MCWNIEPSIFAKWKLIGMALRKQTFQFSIYLYTTYTTYRYRYNDCHFHLRNTIVFWNSICVRGLSAKWLKFQFIPKHIWLSWEFLFISLSRAPHPPFIVFVWKSNTFEYLAFFSSILFVYYYCFGQNRPSRLIRKLLGNNNSFAWPFFDSLQWISWLINPNKRNRFRNTL